jgi:hypothetical protein
MNDVSETGAHNLETQHEGTHYRKICNYQILSYKFPPCSPEPAVISRPLIQDARHTIHTWLLSQMDIRTGSAPTADFHRQSPARTMQAALPGEYMDIEF